MNDAGIKIIPCSYGAYRFYLFGRNTGFQGVQEYLYIAWVFCVEQQLCFIINDFKHFSRLVCPKDQLKIFIGSTDNVSIIDIFNDPVYVVVTLISFFGKYVFYSVTFIASAFIYFDLNEQKYKTGMNERIDNLGKY